MVVNTLRGGTGLNKNLYSYTYQCHFIFIMFFEKNAGKNLPFPPKNNKNVALNKMLHSSVRV